MILRHLDIIVSYLELLCSCISGFMHCLHKNELYTKNIEELYQEKEGVEQKKAIIKGAFLGSGSINNPENLYHLEIVLSNEENMIFLKKIIESLNINTKELQKQDFLFT